MANRRSRPTYPAVFVAALVVMIVALDNSRYFWSGTILAGCLAVWGCVLYSTRNASQVTSGGIEDHDVL